MGYDVHVVRTRDWLKSAKLPITAADVDALIQSDPDLQRSSSDYVGIKTPEGDVRSYAICWKGEPMFWWYLNHISCKNPNDAQVFKLIELADRLGAFVVGDAGEQYVMRRNLFLRRKIATLPEEVD